MLVLLHSSGANPSLWDRVVAHLTGVPVLVPALPGRAGAPWPESRPDRDVAAYGRAVLDAMDAAGAGSATIAGHSLGGAIALWLALEHPSRVRGLGLLGTGARLRVWPHVLEGLADGVRDTLDALGHLQCGPATTDRDRVAIRRMLESTGMEQTLTDLLACDRFDMMDRLGAIKVPTQIMGGSQDGCTPPRYAHYLAERISGARLTMFEGVGHALPLERAEAVAGELAVLWAATADRKPGTTEAETSKTEGGKTKGGAGG